MPITIIVGLLSVSIAIKSALYPFHNWVPSAYDRAYNLSNGISSGLVLKSYIILLIKIYYRVFGLETIVELKILNIFFLFGIMSMLLASLDAVRESNIKKMLSYSSIAQIGYIYVGMSMGTDEGFTAAIFTMISHCFMKPMLFASCEGLMSVSDNSKQIKDLRGAAYFNPVAGLAFGVGTFSMIGFPLFSGFYGKYLLAFAGAGNPSKMWFVLGALILSTLLNAIYFLHVLQLIYTKRTDTKASTCQVTKEYTGYMILFMVINLALGFASALITHLIVVGLDFL